MKPMLKATIPSPQKPTQGGQANVRPPIAAVPTNRQQPVRQAAPAGAGDGLLSFVELEMEARKCQTLDELRFAIVNGSRKVAAFDQAFLAELADTGEWAITRASSVTKIDRHTPYVRGLTAWLNHPSHAELVARGEPRLASLEQEAAAWGIRSQPFQLPNALWVPIKRREGTIAAALIALKAENWRPQHTLLMMPLADAYGHAWEGLTPRSNQHVQSFKLRLGASRLALAGASLAVLAAFVPVPMSALAPAEIVAVDPTLIAAPIEGVISEILLPPGASVRKGDLLVRFVDVKLRNDAEVAKRNKSVAEAKYFRVIQSATAVQKDMQDISLAKSELDVATAELAYAQDLLARSEVRAERDGVLIYTAKSDWVGKPMVIGERLMEIGDPGKTEIKVELPVSDSIAVKAGGRVALFLDGSPLSSISGTVIRTSFKPSMTADQQLAFRIHARFDESETRRIGLRGVARVSSDKVSLWFYLFRRPIAAVRQRIGL